MPIAWLFQDCDKYTYWPEHFKIKICFPDIFLIFHMQFHVNHWQTSSRAGKMLSPKTILSSHLAANSMGTAILQVLQLNIMVYCNFWFCFLTLDHGDKQIHILPGNVYHESNFQNTMYITCQSIFHSFIQQHYSYTAYKSDE